MRPFSRQARTGAEPDAGALAPECPLRQWALLRHADAAREAGRRRGDLADHDEACVVLRFAAAELRCDATDRVKICARAEPEHYRAARTNERQAPLDRRRRLRERLGERDAIPVDDLLLR